LEDDDEDDDDDEEEEEDDDEVVAVSVVVVALAVELAEAPAVTTVLLDVPARLSTNATYAMPAHSLLTPLRAAWASHLARLTASNTPGRLLDTSPPLHCLKRPYNTS
jgi:hypothetical protein